MIKCRYAVSPIMSKNHLVLQSSYFVEYSTLLEKCNQRFFTKAKLSKQVLGLTRQMRSVYILCTMTLKADRRPGPSTI